MTFIKINKTKKLLFISLFFIFFLVSTFIFSFNSSLEINKNNEPSFELKISNINYTNVTVVSDGYNGTYWNNGKSYDPEIAVDLLGNLHAVWCEETNGTWGMDSEIMYAYYRENIGWSNATVISDGYLGYYWNDGDSRDPMIDLDNSGNLHVVWYDKTEGKWGSENEIMYVNYTEGVGWSNITVISDGYNGTYWNDGVSRYSSFIIDSSENIHVVWEEQSDGEWGSDSEIVYINYTQGIGWSNITVISDGFNNTFWDHYMSYRPSITFDASENIHVVWENLIIGILGADFEILYVNYTQGVGWSNVTIISDGFNNTSWNNGMSEYSSIVVDNSQRIHVIWNDETNGTWGSDTEIMHTFCAFDNTPPIWDQLPSDQSFKYGQRFFYDVNASDNFGIWFYSINNTVDFNIDSDYGIIRNDTSLNLGIYWLEIYAYDPFGNYCNATIRILILRNNDYNYYFYLGIAILSITAISASSVGFLFYRYRISKKSMIKRRKGIDYNYLRIDGEQDRLLILSQEENFIDNLSNLNDLKLTAFDKRILDIVKENQWDYNEEREFLREMAFFTPKEQEEILQELKKKYPN